MIKWMQQHWQPSSTESARSQRVWQPAGSSQMEVLEQPDKQLAPTNATQLKIRGSLEIWQTSDSSHPLLLKRNLQMEQALFI